MPVWKRILCGIDFSPPSRVALLQAAELAALHGAELTVLHVRENPSTRALLAMAPSPPEAYEAETGELWRQLERAGKDAELLGKAHVAVAMVEGAAVDEIVRVARDREADVIVIGTHGRTGMRRAMLGSVAERLVRHAPCSVLVARPEELLARGPD